MSIAIGANTPFSNCASQPSPAALRAEVARYQHQLSDSVNCSSAKTLEGKAHIQELSDKISITKKQIQHVEAQQPAANQAVSSSSESASVTYTSAGVTDQSAGAGEGALVNAYA